MRRNKMENGHYTIALPTTTSTLSIPLTDAAEINVSQLDASGKVTAMLTYTRAGTIAAIEKAQARGATITYTP